MLISLSKQFIFVANLKTASTSIEQVLGHVAEIRLERSEWGKHASLAQIEEFDWIPRGVLDFSAFKKFGVIRDPVDWLFSLYQSHQHEKFSNIPHLYTGGMSFDNFISDWCQRNTDQCAPQYTRFLKKGGQHGLDVTILYQELQDIWKLLLEYLDVKAIQNLPTLNVSPEIQANMKLSPDNVNYVEEKYKDDYDLIESSSTAEPVASWRKQLKASGNASSEGNPLTRVARWRKQLTAHGITSSERNLLSREAVVWGYRLILNREPESEESIAHHQRAGTLERLRKNLLASQEYKKLSSLAAIPSSDELPPMQMELSHSDKDLSRLWSHLRQSWETLGQQAPYHSVLTDKRFLPEQFKDNEAAFWSSGQKDLRMIDSTLQRNNAGNRRLRSVLEFGCGVGRVTMHLAERFEHVVAVDISAPHLKVARHRASETGKSNIDFINLMDRDVSDLPQTDLVFSRIVLQHNAPPLMLDITRKLLALVKPGGAALFQLPVYMRGYKFKLDEYLATAEPRMEMHCLPQSVILRLLEKQGFSLQEVRETDDIGRQGDWISNTFFAIRKDAADIGGQGAEHRS